MSPRPSAIATSSVPTRRNQSASASISISGRGRLRRTDRPPPAVARRARMSGRAPSWYGKTLQAGRHINEQATAALQISSCMHSREVFNRLTMRSWWIDDGKSNRHTAAALTRPHCTPVHYLQSKVKIRIEMCRVDCITRGTAHAEPVPQIEPLRSCAQPRQSHRSETGSMASRTRLRSSSVGTASQA